MIGPAAAINVRCCQVFVESSLYEPSFSWKGSTGAVTRGKNRHELVLRSFVQARCDVVGFVELIKMPEITVNVLLVTAYWCICTPTDDPNLDSRSPNPTQTWHDSGMSPRPNNAWHRLTLIRPLLLNALQLAHNGLQVTA
jgi:hypothetical protein